MKSKLKLLFLLPCLLLASCNFKYAYRIDGLVIGGDAGDEVDDGIGYLYRQGDGTDLVEKLKLMYGKKADEAGRVAYEVAHKSFSAPKMSQQYQAVYREIVGR